MIRERFELHWKERKGQIHLCCHGEALDSGFPVLVLSASILSREELLARFGQCLEWCVKPSSMVRKSAFGSPRLFSFKE